MTTLYLGIMPLQEPHRLGPDEAGRCQCIFNVVATKRPSAGTYLWEILKILEVAGVGTVGVDLWGSEATIPEPDPATERPILIASPTGGAGPLGTHNDGPAAYRRPGMQILVRARTWEAAEAMAQAAYSALVAVRNEAVSA
jgi:hypothetical protein